MFDQTKWADMVLENSHHHLKAGTQAIDTIQRQTEKMIDHSVTTMSTIQNETMKNYKNLMDNVQKAQSIFIDSLEEGLTTFEKQFTGKKDPFKTK